MKKPPKETLAERKKRIEEKRTTVEPKEPGKPGRPKKDGPESTCFYCKNKMGPGEKACTVHEYRNCEDYSLFIFGYY